MACSAKHTPSASCNLKDATPPANGSYRVEFHVCDCCCRSELVVIKDGIVYCDGYTVPWADFNGHLVVAEVIASKERAYRILEAPIEIPFTF